MRFIEIHFRVTTLSEIYGQIFHSIDKFYK